MRIWCRQAQLPTPENGCINCHGEPGVQSAKFSEGLNPPPDLRKVITDRRPEELFWVIKNGIKIVRCRASAQMIRRCAIRKYGPLWLS